MAIKTSHMGQYDRRNFIRTSLLAGTAFALNKPVRAISLQGSRLMNWHDRFAHYGQQQG